MVWLRKKQGGVKKRRLASIRFLLKGSHQSHVTGSPRQNLTRLGDKSGATGSKDKKHDKKVAWLTPASRNMVSLSLRQCHTLFISQSRCTTKTPGILRPVFVLTRSVHRNIPANEKHTAKKRTVRPVERHERQKCKL